MHAPLQHDLNRLDEVLGLARDEALTILGSLDARPVAVEPGAFSAAGLTETGDGFAAALDDFNTRFADASYTGGEFYAGVRAF